MTDWLPDKRDQIAGYSFYLEIDGITEAQFREVSGISSETQVIESKEAAKDGKTIIRKVPGAHKFGDITLKRGYTSGDMRLFQWRQLVLEGKLKEARKNGSIVVFDYEDKEVLRWNFANAWPSKLTGPALNAGGNDIAVEEMTLVVEGLSRVK